ncbi:hypothetical protein [Streptomyces sp. NPDC096153]|uniref:hypothetical protein n=1 Tax=Streptomyces sp. NPDC096153 TaxID=3155548 RepID=UPI0033236197
MAAWSIFKSVESGWVMRWLAKVHSLLGKADATSAREAVEELTRYTAQRMGGSTWPR